MEVQTEQNPKKTSLADRVNAQINEERFFKDWGGLQLSRITLLKELAQELIISEQREDICQLLKNNLKDQPAISLTSYYLLGLLDLEEKKQDSNHYLTSLLDTFVKLSKWPIVDHLADTLLSVQENHRAALRAKVESVSHLKGKKESRPFLEKLARIDRKNPDVARKYGLSILEEDREKALTYLKQAGEMYARLKNHKGLEDVWMLMVQHDHKDLLFFERIERILIGDRQKVWVASHLSYLVEPFRAEENWNSVILILKKILQYEPHSSRARSDLVRAYRAKYDGHSLLSEFLKISELTNHKRAVEPCIASFERNIVFDVGNYVYHRTRGVGKLTQIDSSQVVIDFSKNPGQIMSIQMAIHSLQPLQASHIWARHYENPAEMEELFQEDTTLFLETLLSSFGNRVTVNELKHELVGRLLKAEEWSKWWNRARTQIKKDPRFGFNPHKKDELLLREVPMTLTEELSARFQGEADWNKKMELALTCLKDTDTEGAALVAIQFYKENETNKDPFKCLHSYFFLEHARQAQGTEDEITGRKLTSEDIRKMVQESSADDLQLWSKSTQVADLKKDLVNLIVENRPDYTAVLTGFLFEVPIKIHRFIFGELMRLGQEEALRDYFNDICRKYREHPEIFLWVARSILMGQWKDYKWADSSLEDIFLLVCRLLKPLALIEKNGSQLKNIAIATICGTANITVDSLKKYNVLLNIVKYSSPEFLQRFYALFRDVPYIPDAHKENMLDFLREMRTDLDISADQEEELGQEESDSLFPAPGIILSSALALEKRRQYMDHLIHIEMPANSREIGEAQRKGDLRENAEYKAAMERQSQLQAEIASTSKDLQKARVIRPADIRLDLVSIGTRVKVKSSKNQEKQFTILGPWDVDTKHNIVSYESPLAKALMGRKVGEEAILDSTKHYTVSEIHSAFA